MQFQQRLKENAVLAEAQRIREQRAARYGMVGTPEQSINIVEQRLADLEHEELVGIMLDLKLRVLEVVTLATGTIDGAAIHPREVVKQVLACNAAAIVLAHNHPSGNTSPSRSDEVITERLNKAFQLLDIRLLDHIIVAGQLRESSYSFAQAGLIRRNVKGRNDEIF